MHICNVMAERDRRIQDLEKVGQLETKLNAELKHLREKIQTMTDEMARIGSVESLSLIHI